MRKSYAGKLRRNDMAAYYNETDPYAAQWLRNLITAGHIAAGDVDERSIEDVNPEDLRGYAQCHFFAGIGVWSLALRRAGWPDDRPVWTGSCPCQPFSAAGKGAGFDDERHLWPAWEWLIAQCRPPVIIGEQIASKAAEPWIDLVQTDLEAMDYAFGCIAFPSAGVGAPHIRDRAYWLADAGGAGPQGLTGDGGAAGRQGSDRSVTEAGSPSGLANTDGKRQQGIDSSIREEQVCDVKINRSGETCSKCRNDKGHCICVLSCVNDGEHPGPVNGFWRDADWLGCRDGKWRPVEPGTFPLVDGTPQRVGRLRANWDTPAGKEGFGHRTGRLKGYGNAINAEAATIFIQSVMELLNSSSGRDSLHDKQHSKTQ